MEGRRNLSTAGWIGVVLCALSVLGMIGVHPFSIAADRHVERTLFVDVAPNLDTHGAWVVGENPPSDRRTSAPRPFVEVTHVEDGRIVLTVALHASQHVHRTRLELDLRGDDPHARVTSYGETVDSRGGSTKIGGVVLLSSSSIPREGDRPLVIEYDLEIEYPGSPLGDEGKVALTADDLRR